MHDLLETLLDDPRISAIGLHIEGLKDVAAFAAPPRKASSARCPSWCSRPAAPNRARRWR
jgi:hypothetical protein